MSRDLDDAALAVLLRFGSLLAEDTPFRAVRALPPGACLSWENGELRLAATGPLIARVDAVTESDAKKAYADLFKAAVAFSAPPSDDYVVPLSGGRDSRHILLELFTSGRAPRTCVTQALFSAESNFPDPEVDIARRLCDMMGIEHVVVPPWSSRRDAELRKNLLTQFSSLEHAWALPVADCATEGWDYVFDGIAGDVLSAGLFLNEKRFELFDQRRLGELADDLLIEDGHLAVFLPPKLRRRLGRDLARERMIAELARHVAAPNPIGSFIFWNRTRRAIAASAVGLFGRRASVITPYLDHRLYDFLASLPGRMFIDHRFHTDVIAQAYPGFADVPYAVKERRTEVPRARRFAREMLFYALGHVGHAPLMRVSAVTPRMLRGLIDNRYLPAVLDMAALAVFLVELGELGEPAS